MSVSELLRSGFILLCPLAGWNDEQTLHGSLRSGGSRVSHSRLSKRYALSCKVEVRKSSRMQIWLGSHATYNIGDLSLILIGSQPALLIRVQTHVWRNQRSRDTTNVVCLWIPISLNNPFIASVAKAGAGQGLRHRRPGRPPSANGELVNQGQKVHSHILLKSNIYKWCSENWKYNNLASE